MNPAKGYRRFMISVASCLTALECFVALGWLTAGPLLGHEIRLVSPRGLDQREGLNRGSGTANPFRIQYLYPAADFASLPDGHRTLIGFAQRADQSQPVDATVEFSAVRIVLGTTSIEHLSGTFTDNLPHDRKVVFDGSASFTITAGGAATPNLFGTPFRFQDPYTYDPDQGNLLVDITSTVSARSNPWLDFEPTSSQTLVFAPDPSAPGADPANFLQVRQFIFVSDTRGDFNDDAALDAADIDLLSESIRQGLSSVELDLNADGELSFQDQVIWVTELKRTYFGDANLDGQLDSLDLVHVFQAGQYEDGIPRNSTWTTGDWNGDADFDSSDLVLAFQDGGYERGPRATTGAVPEPSGLVPCLPALVLLGYARWWAPPKLDPGRRTRI